MAQGMLQSASGYLPLLRFDRAVAQRELRWAGLGGSGKGHRAVAGWDDAQVAGVMGGNALALLGETP